MSTGELQVPWLDKNSWTAVSLFHGRAGRPKAWGRVTRIKVD